MMSHESGHFGFGFGGGDITASTQGIIDPSSPDFVNFGQPNLVQQQGTGFGDLDFSGKLGAIGQGVSAFSTLAQIYAGFKGMKLAKDQFKFQKDAFNLNFNAQVQGFNNELKDKHQANANVAASRGNTFESLGTFLSGRQIDPIPTGG